LYITAIAHAWKNYEEYYGKESGNLSEQKGSSLSERYSNHSFLSKSHLLIIYHSVCLACGNKYLHKIKEIFPR
jgi:hypothetical protein